MNTINCILKIIQNFRKKGQHQPDVSNQKEKGMRSGLEKGQAAVRESGNLDKMHKGLKVDDSIRNGREMYTER